MSSDTVTMAPRFCGPSSSGHGGYVSGLAADASLADESRHVRSFVWALDCTGGLAVLPVPEGRAVWIEAAEAAFLPGPERSG